MTMTSAGKTRLFFWLLPFLLVFLSCGKDPHEERAEKDRLKILAYIEEHGLEATELDSGVFIVKEVEGSGPYPNEESKISLFYVGSLLDGTVFDSQYAENMDLRFVVRGFSMGILEFRRGGKGIILVPSGLGYGERGTYTIPRNAVLVFEVEIFDFQ